MTSISPPALGGGVGIARAQPVALARLAAVREVAVDLVGADLEEAGHAVLARGLQQHEDAVNVGADEAARIVERAVDVAVGGEVDDRVAARHRGVDCPLVGDVGLHEGEARVARQVGEVGRVAGVGQLVHHHDPVLRVLLQQYVDIIGADEARPARHQHPLENAIRHRRSFPARLLIAPIARCRG